MSEYVRKAFVVLVDVMVENSWPQRERFVVASPTREEAEGKIKSLYSSEQDVRVFALALSAIETEQLEYQKARSDAGSSARRALAAKSSGFPSPWL